LILSDGEIWEALEKGDIVITTSPGRPTGEQLPPLVQPSSVDLRLGPKLLVHRNTPVPGVSIDPSTVDVMDHLQRYCDPVDISNGVPFEIRPLSFVLGTTLEWVELPLDLAARVEGKSRLARFGLAVHITAPKIDPGFKNHITLEMFNFGPFPLKLTYKMEICVLIIEQLGRRARQGYSGQFQGQQI
jgi:dCTP deaminase